MVPPGEGNEARGDGRRGVGVSHSTAEAGELSPRDPVEGRGHRQVAPVEGKTANTPRLGPVSTSRQRIAELARQALGMAVAIAWLPGPTGTRRRVAKPSVEEPDAAEPARPDLWGARVSNDPGLPDLPVARHSPSGQEPCRVGAHDEQEDAHRRGEQGEHRNHVSSEYLLIREYSQALKVADGVGMLLVQERRQGLEFALRGVSRSIRTQTSQELVVEACALGIRAKWKRGPEVDRWE